MKKTLTEKALEKLDAEISVLQQVRIRLAETAASRKPAIRAPRKPKTRVANSDEA